MRRGGAARAALSSGRGAAATTLLAPDEFVVTAEYKINLLRGERLNCRAEVLKPGQSLSVVEASVHAERDGKRELVATLNATMAVVRPRREPAPVVAAAPRCISEGA